MKWNLILCFIIWNFPFSFSVLFLLKEGVDSSQVIYWHKADKLFALFILFITYKFSHAFFSVSLSNLSIEISHDQLTVDFLRQ